MVPRSPWLGNETRLLAYAALHDCHTLGVTLPGIPQRRAGGGAFPVVQSAAVNEHGDTSERSEQLGVVVQRLVAALRPERIYLFGSRARGDADQDSDFDLLVVVPEVIGSPYRLHQQALGVLWGLGAPVDVLVVSRERFERQRGVVASLPATVEREGRLLYAA